MKRSLGLLSDRLVARSFVGLLIRGMEVGGKLALYVVVAHRFGAAASGLFFVAMNWVSLGAGIARMGLERAVMRHMPVELASGRSRSALWLLRSTMVRVLFAAVVVGGLTVALGQPVATFLLGVPAYGVPLMLSALLLVPEALTITAGNALVALKCPVEAQLVQNALWPPMTFACVLAGASDVPQVLVAASCCRLATLALALALLWRNRAAFGRPEDPIQASAAVSLTQLWQTARPLYVVELVQVAQISLPTLVLGAFVDSALVGAFSAANRLTILTYVILVSIAAVMSPYLAEHHHTGRWAELRRVNHTSRLAAAGLALPMLVMMMVLAPWLLEFLGPGFSSASFPLRIMAVGQMLNAVFSGQDILLAMTGHAGLLRWINLVNLAVCLLLSAVVIPAFGIVGAGLVTAVATGFGPIAAMVVARRKVPQAF